jgi:hypothetical protein
MRVQRHAAIFARDAQRPQFDRGATQYVASPVRHLPSPLSTSFIGVPAALGKGAHRTIGPPNSVPK